MPGTVGIQLKNARSQRNLTLEQVEKSTRIRKTYLEALENDQYDLLPSAVQGKGFLRLYASFLELNITSILAEYEGKPSSPTVKAEKSLDPRENIPIPPPLDRKEITPVTSENFSLSDGTVEVKPTQLQAVLSLPEEKSTPSQSILVEIGSLLKKQRETLGLSLEEVEQYTHVRSRYLQALETGKISDLPSPVQGRGMLHNYAIFLNLDADGLLLKFADALQSRRIERMPAAPTTSSSTKKKNIKRSNSLSTWLTTDLLAAGGIILFLVGFVIWGSARINSINENTMIESPPPIGKVLLTTPTPISFTPTGLMAPTAQVLAEDRAKTPIIPAVTGTLPPINDAPIQIYIIARERVYLRIVVDGKEVLNTRVVPGNAYAFSGSKQIELLTGSAGSIQVYYNQKDLGNLGQPGQGLNLVFTSRGMVTPTATTIPSATSTPIVTRTITPTASPMPPTPTVTLFVP